jgi:Uma2 family endonuclease
LRASPRCRLCRRRADLVIEVLSPSTRQIDRFRKLEEYKTVPSIRSILLVEPSLPTAKLYQRGEEDRWRDADFLGLDAAVEIADLALRFSLRDLYEGLSFDPPKAAPSSA